MIPEGQSYNVFFFNLFKFLALLFLLLLLLLFFFDGLSSVVLTLPS